MLQKRKGQPTGPKIKSKKARLSPPPFAKSNGANGKNKVNGHAPTPKLVQEPSDDEEEDFISDDEEDLMARAREMMNFDEGDASSDELSQDEDSKEEEEGESYYVDAEEGAQDEGGDFEDLEQPSTTKQKPSKVKAVAVQPSTEVEAVLSRSIPTSFSELSAQGDSAQGESCKARPIFEFNLTATYSPNSSSVPSKPLPSPNPYSNPFFPHLNPPSNPSLPLRRSLYPKASSPLNLFSFPFPTLDRNPTKRSGSYATYRQLV